MIFKSKVYNVLKFIALVLLPAISAFYFAVAKYWNLPYPEQVVGTLAAVDTFVGVLVGISNANYIKQTGNYAFTNEDGSVEQLVPVTMRDIMKWIAQIFIPAVATLYFALADIWVLPYPEQIVGTLMAFDAVLGAILGISSEAYTKPLNG